MNLPPDKYHTKANTELEEKKRELIYFQLAGDIKNTVQEKLFIRQCCFPVLQYLQKLLFGETIFF